MKKLKPDIVKFNKYSIIKLKIYSPNCIVKSENQ